MDEQSKAPKDADASLASSISSGLFLESDLVTDAILRLNLFESSRAAVQCQVWSERNALRLIAKFEGLLEMFLESNTFSIDKLKNAVREDLTDEQVQSLVVQCSTSLESWFSEIDRRREIISRCVRFVSIVIDARFVGWFVKSGPMGAPLSRLTALVKRYRERLFREQQNRFKPEGSEIDKMLKSRADPKADGKIFFYQLQ